MSSNKFHYGNLTISGSLMAQSITGSLQGTASYALNASSSISSSYTLTASYATNAGTTVDTGSFVTTSSFNNFTSSYSTGSFTGSFVGGGSGLTGIISASLAQTASYVINATSASFSTTSSITTQISTSISTQNLQHNVLFIDTTGPGFVQIDGGLRYNPNQDLLTTTSSYALTASYVQNAQSASYYGGAVTSASYAITASYVKNAQSASYYVETDPIFVAKSGSFATTGSNIFSGSQTIQGNLSVIGTASFTYTTSSIINIGSSIITLNTDNPAARFGGITVIDSGSFGTDSTGSLLWDSLNNRWIYSNPSGSTYDGGMLISGPRNTIGLGSEVGVTNNFLTVGNGADHISSSMIFHSASITQITGSLEVIDGITGSLLGTASTASYYDETDPIFVAKSGSLATTGSNIFVDTQIITGSTSTDLVRITQTGAGNAFVVEDSTNPDSTPFVINNNGQVGIGTTTPSNVKLDIVTSGSTPGTATALRIRETSSNSQFNLTAFSSSAAGRYLRLSEDTTGAAVMIWTQTGNVGIGTSTPNSKLDVNGNAIITGSLTIKGAGASGVVLDTDTNDNFQSTRLFFKMSGSGNDVSMRNLSGSLLVATQATSGVSSGTTTAMFISSSGKIAIGNTQPTLGNLQVLGNVYATSFTGSLLGTASTASYVQNAQTSSYYAETDPIFVAKSGSLATTGSNTFVGTQTIQGLTRITGTSTNELVRITQTGTGAALIVEDETNPDTSPFIIDNVGNVGIGTTTPSYQLDITSLSNDNGTLRILGSGSFKRGIIYLGTNDIISGSGHENGRISFLGSGSFEYGTIISQLKNTTSGSEEGEIIFRVRKPSQTITNSEIFRVTSTGISIGKTGSNASLDVSGSAIITGSLTVTAGITGSLLGTASTASYVDNAQSASYYVETDPIFVAKSGSLATTGSNTFTGNQTINGDIIVRGTASVDVFYSIYNTSSIIYSSGSTKFGDTLDDTHEFTGSILVSGSLYAPSITGSLSGSVTHALTASSGDNFRVRGTLNADGIQFIRQYTTSSVNFLSSSLSIGKGVTSDSALDVKGSTIITGSLNISGSGDIPELVVGINKLFISSSGNIGIGTSTPTSKLDVVGNIHISYTGSNNHTISQTNGVFGYGKITPFNSNGQFVFDTYATSSIASSGYSFQYSGSSVLMFMSSSGNIGIGTGSPNAKLAVLGNTNITGSLNVTQNITGSGLQITGSTTTDLVRITQTGTGNAFVVEDTTNPDTSPFVIDNSGDVGIGISSPSRILHTSGSTNGTSVPLFEGMASSETRFLTIKRTDGTAEAFINYTGADLAFGANSKERLRIGRYGDIVIGTTSSAAGARLYLTGNDDGNIIRTTPLLIASASANTDLVRFTQTGTGNSFVVEDTNTPDSSQFVINNVGDVGVGTTTPNSKLEVNGNTNITGSLTVTGSINSYDNITLLQNATYLQGKNSSNVTTRILGINSSNILYIGSVDAAIGSIFFNINGSNLLQISSSGDVGLGKLNPTAKLDISGSALITGSLTVTAGITGSLLGTASTASYVTLAQTASYVVNAISASYIEIAQTASYFSGSISNATNAVSASYALTASYVNPLIQDVVVTGSLNVTAGITGSLLGTATTASYVNPLIQNVVVTGSLTVTSNITGSGLQITGSTSTDLVKITQTGAGNAFVVEDSTSPDSTAFVIDSAGSVGIGNSVLAGTKLFAYTTDGTAIFGQGSTYGIQAQSEGIGIKGVGVSDNGTVIGVEGQATQYDQADGTYIGGKFSTNNAIPNSYSVQLQDGTEGVGKVLVSQTTDGKANWSTKLSGSYEITGSLAISGSVIGQSGNTISSDALVQASLLYLSNNF